MTFEERENQVRKQERINAYFAVSLFLLTVLVALLAAYVLGVL